MGPENGINLAKVSYFPLEEYTNRIKLTNDVLSHVEDTGEQFSKYMNELKKYSNIAIINFLIDSFSNEIIDSNKIENHIISPLEISRENIFINSMSMNNKRIKELHKFVTRSEHIDDYRTEDARVSYIEDNGKEHIFWYGANPEDIKKFMDDFIKIYQNRSFSALDMNPFIKSALAHLIFVRIHPFGDGNGRTARIIHTIKFTKMVNEIYGCNLKISPLHLSQSILINKPTYLKRINNIYFDLNHDSNDEINKYLDFMLDMTDEQIYFMSNKLEQIGPMLEKKEDITDNEELEKMANTMKLVRKRR